jgi:hypothetical protein
VFVFVAFRHAGRDETRVDGIGGDGVRKTLDEQRSRRQNDQGRDGQEIRSSFSRRGGRGVRVRDLVRVSKSALHVFRGELGHSGLEVLIRRFEYRNYLLDYIKASFISIHTITVFIYRIFQSFYTK